MKATAALAAAFLAASALPGAAKAASKAAAGDAEYAPPPPAPILSTDISGGDLLFLTSAARQINQAARLSGLAKNKAVTPEVQALAAAVWKEQSAAAARLKDLAARKHVPLQSEPDLPAKRELDALARLEGIRFDKACIDALGEAQALLETSLSAGAASSDKDIQAFAQANLGTLKQEQKQLSRLGI